MSDVIHVKSAVLGEYDVDDLWYSVRVSGIYLTDPDDERDEGEIERYLHDVAMDLSHAKPGLGGINIVWDESDLCSGYIHRDYIIPALESLEKNGVSPDGVAVELTYKPLEEDEEQLCGIDRIYRYPNTFEDLLEDLAFYGGYVFYHAEKVAGDGRSVGTEYQQPLD